MESIHSRRDEILSNYFQSIGIGAESQAKWDKVKELIHNYNYEGQFKANKMSLK